MTDEGRRRETHHAERRRASIGRPSPFSRKRLPTLPHRRALDIACGDSLNTFLLARHGLAVQAIDFVRTGLERSRSAFRSEGLTAGFVQSDLESEDGRTFLARMVARRPID